MINRETLCAMALARIGVYRPAEIKEIYTRFGSAAEVWENRNDIVHALQPGSPRLAEYLQRLPQFLQEAEEEARWCEANGIQAVPMSADAYPTRLAECADAPVILYMRGHVSLNAKRVVAMVGTRKATLYGLDLTRRFLARLKTLCPETLVISGLAYGIDISAHREALHNALSTAAVLAHGLDTLYPPQHKATAQQMLENGALITEFGRGTRPEKHNFVQRNRIVAGMCDACIVVESAAKGGALITAELTANYGRELFAFPGRVDDLSSEGCNRLIMQNKAALISSADDFVQAVGWEGDARLQQAREQGIERSMFPQLDADEQRVVSALSTENDQQINELSRVTAIPVGKLSALLFSLELKGVVKALAGGAYHLLK